MSLPTQQFTSRELKWMRRWRSQAHLRTKDGSRPTSHSEWKDLLNKIADDVSSGKSNFSGLSWHKVNKKYVLSSNLLEDILVIRKINSNIRRCYSLHEPNRRQLIRTAKQALSEPVPKTVLRIDLKSCYESIDRARTIKTLKTDSLLSTETIGLIEKLFRLTHKKIKGNLKHGIPRGLVLSTSLAEITLRKLDSQLRSNQGTYLVIRYVDDILIFTTEECDKALRQVRTIVKKLGLKINESKQKLSKIRIACNCESTCTHGSHCPCAKKCTCLDRSPHLTHEIDFLGYKLIFPAYNTSKKNSLNQVYCTFSTRKISRTKHRIWMAIYSFIADRDLSLLRDRILFLADNQKLESQPGRRGLLAGLSYTHSECNHSDPHVISSLQEIDNFFQAQIRKSVQGEINKDQYEELKKISFKSGFIHYRRTKFTGSRVLQIKSCWRV